MANSSERVTLRLTERLKRGYLMYGGVKGIRAFIKALLGDDDIYDLRAHREWFETNLENDDD
jgi:hypothetical protein